MFITANRNIVLPSADGTRRFKVERVFVGNIPDWAAKTAYFAALVKDGKIIAPKSKKDKDLEGAKKPKSPAKQGDLKETEAKEGPMEEAGVPPPEEEPPAPEEP